jgi:ubiquinone/menaquinone biosynthesis C-methylase UbiE
MNPTQRFSNRVADYIKYRPHYPDSVYDFLQETLPLSSASIIADVGSGTGILTQLFLKNNHIVFAIEPNQEMREAAEKILHAYPNFRSVNATAEATTLASNSVEVVTAGQAFHWFEVPKAKAEFIRILKKDGWVVLIWNEREIDGPFQQEYEQLLGDYALNYQQINHKNIDDHRLRELFDYQLQTFANQQIFDYTGLSGRLLSSSYAPLPDQPQHAPMMDQLQRIFEKYQTDGVVYFNYQTKVYYGQLHS